MTEWASKLNTNRHGGWGGRRVHSQCGTMIFCALVTETYAGRQKEHAGCGLVNDCLRRVVFSHSERAEKEANQIGCICLSQRKKKSELVYEAEA